MELTSSYNFPLVSFSVFIAVLASYVALELTKRMTVPITYDLTTVEQINPSLKSFSSSVTPYLCSSVREAKKTVPVFALKAIAPRLGGSRDHAVLPSADRIYYNCSRRQLTFPTYRKSIYFNYEKKRLC